MSSRRPRSNRKPASTETLEDMVSTPPPVSEGGRRRRTAKTSTHQASPPKQSGSHSSRAHTSSAPTAGRQQQQQQPLPLQAGGPALETKYILSHPRLQQTTGMLPRKLGWWQGVELPRDELLRLAWAMNLPDTYPRKKPKGNF